MVPLIRLTTFLLLLLALPAQAAQLFAIVSERSSAQWAQAAAQFSQRHPDHRLQARTPEQLAGEDWQQLRRQLLEADTLLVAGVFGETVERLLQLPESPGQDRIAVHSDRRLLAWTRLDDRPLWQQAPEGLVDRWRQPPKDRPLSQWLEQQAQQHPRQYPWLETKSYWQQHGVANLEALIGRLLQPFDSDIEVAAVQPRAPVRIWVDGNWSVPGEPLARPLDPSRQTLFLLDHEGADRKGDWDLTQSLCRQTRLQCVIVLAAWGEPTREAIDWMAAQLPADTPQLLVALRDFVLGGGQQREAVTERLNHWRVPVIKGIRVWEQTDSQWQLSRQGLPLESVHYRVAMPELQGIGQPLVLAVASAPQVDPLTGLQLRLSQPLPGQIRLLKRRIQRWLALQDKANADKKIAIIYYNHPPGRHNIGADNLNVPESLFEILQALQAAGYHTGPLPDSAEALLDAIQRRAVNLPEDAEALATLSQEADTLSAEAYGTYFRTLPATLQAEMVEGPLGYLYAYLKRALEAGETALAERQLEDSITDIRHLLEGVDHPGRDRALDLLAQLQARYHDCLAGKPCWQDSRDLTDALLASGIEGIRGWGEVPGRVMVWDNRLLVPGLQFGNIFIGPQPPRGWELNEELLHANTSFPPPHQYLAFYHYLRESFQADALVHLGRHSTYEFLPRRRVGLTDDDYATRLIDDLPSVYPYIVDGVGEGIQAKRRGSAVMVDHLTPPLVATPLYDDLLALRQLLESFEAAETSQDSALQQQAVSRIRTTIDELEMREELEASMAAELAVRGVSFEQVDDELLIHEVGHYLTQLQEKFMPQGLHVFGRDWNEQAVSSMLGSIAGDPEVQARWRRPLEESPAREMAALLAGLDGRFIAPGKGNDPIRTPESLPTGRNFFALDGSLIPSEIGYRQGAKLAAEARRTHPAVEGEREAVVLWASDAVRDEGAMIGFGLDMLGVRPIWSRRGIVKSIERIPTPELQAQQRLRRDVVFTTSGLFRDLYGEQLEWLDRAVLLTLDAASHTIRRDYPALTLALEKTLAPLGELGDPGDESLALNRVAANWVRDTLAQLAEGVAPAEAGALSAQRLFGTAPGTYGAGVNRAVERSGSWQQRSQVADVYLKRMGYAYGIDRQGTPAHGNFNRMLGTVGNTYLGRASNLYGLMDNNDAFDFLGGLNMAVEKLRDGQAPASWVVEQRGDRSQVKALGEAMMQEFRGRYINPAWIQPLMAEGYAGARTMGSEFMEYLWGWQVTSPELVKEWLWDEVKAVYMDDKLELGLDEFLSREHNAHVYSNMMAVMLVAAEKGFWNPDPQVIEELSRRFAELVLANGLPGSGHTTPDHPIYDFVRPHLPDAQWQQLQQLLDKSRVSYESDAPAPVHIQELDAAEPQSESGEQSEPLLDWRWLLVLVAALFMIGLFRGRRAL